jgi:predicted Zn-dependent protease
VYVEAGEMKKAFEVIEEGVYQQPKNVSLLYRLAGLLMKDGKFKHGLVVLSEGLEMDYDKHKELFEFFPELELNAEIQDLIQSYFKKK